MSDNGRLGLGEFVRQHGEQQGNDKAGRASRQPVFAMRLRLKDGFGGLLYGHYKGMPFMDEACTRIEIPFEGLVRLNGSWKRIDGDWLAVIKGRNLEPVFDQILESKRISVHPSQSADPKDAQVDSVDIEELPWN
jgi:hypothetical protein